SKYCMKHNYTLKGVSQVERYISVRKETQSKSVKVKLISLSPSVPPFLLPPPLLSDTVQLFNDV
ncbi:hypothetical protein, partial [Thiolapillus sp.]|uniref:hypothetical protein n=1 Tax=Thiolapillus sp. TaxID=2017437 RepID=UPI003AF7A219